MSDGSVEYKYYCATCGEPLPLLPGKYVTTLYSYGEVAKEMAVWNRYGNTMLPYFGLPDAEDDKFFAVTFCNSKCAMLFKMGRY